MDFTITMRHGDLTNTTGGHDGYMGMKWDRSGSIERSPNIESELILVHPDPFLGSIILVHTAYPYTCTSRK